MNRCFRQWLGAQWQWLGAQWQWLGAQWQWLGAQWQWLGAQWQWLGAQWQWLGAQWQWLGAGWQWLGAVAVAGCTVAVAGCTVAVAGCTVAVAGCTVAVGRTLIPAVVRSKSYVSGLVPDCSDSSALAMWLLQCSLSHGYDPRCCVMSLGHNCLTYWGWVTHICVGKLTIISSDNGLSPERRQAIIWTNSGILLIWPLGTNFSEILIKIYTFSFKKMHLKMSGKWRPFVSASMC